MRTFSRRGQKRPAEVVTGLWGYLRVDGLALTPNILSCYSMDIKTSFVRRRFSADLKMIHSVP